MVKITLIHHEVWKSLSLDQTELHVLGKWSRLNHNLTLTLTDLILTKIWTFVVIDDKGGEQQRQSQQGGEKQEKQR